MSWFESGSLSSFAKTAFTNAQKSIDRVLDIQEDELGALNQTADPPTSLQKPKSSSQVETREEKSSVRPIKQAEGNEAPSPKTPTPPATKKFQDDSDNFWNSFFDASAASPAPVTAEKSNPPKKTRPSSRRPQAKQKSLGVTKLPGSLHRDIKDEQEDDEDSPVTSERSRQRKPLRLKTSGKSSAKNVKTKEESVKVEKEKSKNEEVEKEESKRDEVVEESSKIDIKPIEKVEIKEETSEAVAEQISVAKVEPIEETIEDTQQIKDESQKEADEVTTCSNDESEKLDDSQKLEDTLEQESKDEMDSSGMTISQEPEMLEIPDENAELDQVKQPDSLDSKSENSIGNNMLSHERTSSRSDSDFVVINETGTGSEQSSLYNYDTRTSPENQSPKHYSSSSNGKRSPDSDFSIISEGRFHDMQDSVHSGIHVNTDCAQDSPLSPPQRASPSYSADVESEDQDDKSTAPSSREGVEDRNREEGTSTPTPDSDLSPTGGPDEDAKCLRKESEATPRAVRKGSDAGEMKSKDSSSDKDSVTANKDSTPTGDVTPSNQNPLQTEKLLKTHKDDQKLAEMAEVMQAREAQILSLSKQNMDLTETTNILRNQLQQSESARESEMQDLSALTEEFTQRIASMEKKLQAAMKERDTARKEVQQLNKDIAKNNTSDQSKQLLEEKDGQIQELLAEGEKLSKQQLQNSNIIKKLRVKEKDNESLLKSQKKELDESLERLKHLEEVLDAKEEIEKQQKDSIKKLNTAVEQQDKELNYTRSEMEDAKEKARSVQNALDGSYKEIAELHKKLAAKDSRAQETALSVEMNAKEELRLALERSQQEARRGHEGLLLQVSDLQMTLGRSEQQYGRKEETLRQEISDLQMRLQEAESRNQELTQSVTAATRPLLRQIENLQSNFNAQSSTWEQVERSLTERLADSQSQLASATEKERMVTESALEAGSKLASLESQLALMRQEKSRLAAALEMEKAKVESLEENKHRELAQADSQRQTYLKALEDSQREKGALERQLETEKMQVESERKKLMLAQEALNDKERRLQQQQQQIEDSSSSHSPISRSSTPTLHSNHSAPITPLTSTPMPTQGDILERTMSWSVSGTSVYESIAGGSASSIMENLQAQLKQREGEIAQLQGEIQQLERTRASMAEEIVKMSNTCESMEEQVKEIPELRKIAKEIEHRYNAVLQMYGEKAEEVQELKLDLQDVKEMYRQQIEDLIRRS
ncbi:LOW QUALITY PROTEIN: uncharacterized protein [Amphiura filiformis]|uniref:LOW QUALITY PROTEIN: uncharacterized protein n=1 Tax=Amphiura filiformis TaxID=82378 RepID=UPI003B2244EA